MLTYAGGNLPLLPIALHSDSTIFRLVEPRPLAWSRTALRLVARSIHLFTLPRRLKFREMQPALAPHENALVCQHSSYSSMPAPSAACRRCFRSFAPSADLTCHGLVLGLANGQWSLSVYAVPDPSKWTAIDLALSTVYALDLTSVHD